MSEDVRVSKFTTLFAGNQNLHGSEEGGCVRQPITPALWNRHLTAGPGIGIYPLVHVNEWKVRWGCVDLDVKAPHKRRWDYESPTDAFTAAQNLATALGVLGIRSWVERTKSGGFHVWVFANEWIPAASMRRCLLVACRLADVPPTEVNPKSEGFADTDMVGNYVRLPYVKGWERPMVTEHGDPISFADFIDIAWADRTDQATIDQTAALWRPEEPTRPAKVVAATRIPAEVGMLSRRLRAVTENGPLREEDRSGWLFYVARLCRDDGLSHAEAVNVVTHADDTHTRKFTDRHDGPRQIERTVDRAYS